MAHRRRNTSIGIDLGSSYCCVGAWNSIHNTVEMIPNDLGERTTPSFVAFTQKERLIGTPAKNQAARNAQNTVFDIVRLIGRNYDEESLQKDMKLWPFRVERKSNGRIAIKINGTHYFPEEIVSIIFLYLRNIAEDYLGCKVDNAVVSIPVFFTDSQRQSVFIAGRLAGLNIIRVVSAPTLASMAYGMTCIGEKNVVVFDLGGNSLDISVVVVDDGVFDVKAVAWAKNVGGKDFDDILVDYFVKEFKTKTKADCSTSSRAMRRLRTQCEKAKRILSVATRANIDIDTLHDGIDFTSTITRAKFEELCMDHFNQCLEAITKALEDASYEDILADINEVILVGGSSRIPKMQQMIKEYFKGKELCKSINPDEAVAYGAAIQAAILSGAEMGDAGDVLLF